jgi:hypothetical protein
MYQALEASLPDWISLEAVQPGNSKQQAASTTVSLE